MPRPHSSTEGALSESLSLRLLPRIRFGLMLAARIERVSMSEATHLLLDSALSGDSATLARLKIAELSELWSPKPWTRLQNLQERRPDLLTGKERSLLQMLKEQAAPVTDDTFGELCAQCGVKF